MSIYLNLKEVLAKAQRRKVFIINFIFTLCVSASLREELW